MRTAHALVIFAGVSSSLGCGSADEMRIANRLADTVSLDVLAPRADLRGGCDVDFRTRFCSEEYEPIGIVDVASGEDRFLTISDPVTSSRCTNVLWLRLVWFGDVGPVVDPGTTIQLPAIAEVEAGGGRFHSVAFPQGTVRIDEIGPEDLNQGFQPETCAALGRAAR